MEPKQSVDQSEDRRGFFMRTGAIIFGGLAALGPLLAALPVMLNPLRKKSVETKALRITTLGALPADGVPRQFPVRSKRVDAWTTYEETPIGAVYLRRTPDGKVTALNVVCPHAGCFVTYAARLGKFSCPCHDSTFTLDGSIDNPGSPSPRAMDALQVEIREGEEVWVEFKNFQPGHKEQVPVA